MNARDRTAVMVSPRSAHLPTLIGLACLALVGPSRPAYAFGAQMLYHAINWTMEDEAIVP